ncbi:hypothetical protein BU26DRAFT_187559 [Trematosphaeria pertusa]|uniref:Uncharacterized protein n=1 Tax=Trematosphaeria pertusa TaxID=390896 RepID=A0A6A6HRC8_9PLEO|nr:uncharacterized protein BU26DRAFT_187559 [Trematosphaeria pertusa]KAF2240714.1 hypothetical protein BU26DRAFT_187559 [Trematosphaeria pertusa]
MCKCTLPPAARPWLVRLQTVLVDLHGRLLRGLVSHKAAAKHHGPCDSPGAAHLLCPSHSRNLKLLDDRFPGRWLLLRRPKQQWLTKQRPGKAIPAGHWKNTTPCKRRGHARYQSAPRIRSDYKYLNIRDCRFGIRSACCYTRTASTAHCLLPCADSFSRPHSILRPESTAHERTNGLVKLTTSSKGMLRLWSFARLAVSEPLSYTVLYSARLATASNASTIEQTPTH